MEVGPKPVLSKLARSWWKPPAADADLDPLWLASLDKGCALGLDECLKTIEQFKVTGSLNQTATKDAESDLDIIFPNRIRMPWIESPPHPLLQHAIPIGSRGSEFHTIFHEKLMDLYKDHVIAGRNIFPGAAYIEMGLAAGKMMVKAKGISSGGVELLDVRFVRPFDLEQNCKMV